MMLSCVVYLSVNTCRHAFVFPQSSVTVKVRVIVPPQPSPTKGPVTHRNESSVSQLSLALAPANSRNAARFAGQYGTSQARRTVYGRGHMMHGGVVSLTVNT